MESQICPSCQSRVLMGNSGACPACRTAGLPSTSTPPPELPNYPCPPYGLGLSDANELYFRVPGHRKSGTNSALLVASLVVWLGAGLLPAGLGFMLGLLATLAVCAVCVIVLTGPVYLPHLDAKRPYHLAEWPWPNKVAAVLFLVMQILGVFLLGLLALNLL